MANLPTAVPTNPTAIGVAPPDVSTMIPRFNNPGVVGQAMEGAAAQMGQAGAVLADANNRQAYADGMSKFLQQKLSLDQAAETDPDYSTLPQRYAQSLRQAATTASSGITSPTMRAEFSDSLTRIMSFAQGDVLRASRAKAVDADKAWLGGIINQNADAASRLTNDADVAALHDATDRAIAATQQKGSISATDAANLGRSYASQVAETRFRLLAVNDPQAAMALIGRAVSGNTATPGALPNNAPPDIGAAITSAANAHGVDPSTLIRIADLESGFNPTAQNRSGASGLFQLMPATAQQYGVSNPTDVGQSADAAARLTSANAQALTQSLGRSPTPAELYLAHQQGAASASALLADRDQPAVDALAAAYGGDQAKARAAIVANGGTPDMLSGEFTDAWARRFAGPRPSASAVASGAPSSGSTGTLADFLPANKLVELYDFAKRQLDQQDVGFRGDVERRFKNNLEALSLTGNPAEPLSEGEIRTAFPKDAGRADLMLRELQGAQAVGQARGNMALTGPDEDQAMLARFQPTANAPDYGDQVSRYGAVLEAYKAKQAALVGPKADPATYVLQNSPQIAQLFQAAAQDPNKLEPAVSALDAAYDKLGVPSDARPMLTKPQAQGTVSKLLSAPPDQRAAALTSMAQSYGELWPRVQGDLVTHGGLPTLYETMSAVDNPAVRTQIAKAIGDGKKDLQDAIPKADREDVDTAIDQSHDLADLMHSLSYAADGTTKGVEVKEAARIASYGLAQTMSPSAAVKTVTAALTTDKYDFWRNGSGIATVPKGTLPDVEASADDVLSNLKGSDLARPLYLSPAATKDVSPDVIERAQLLAAQGGTWVRNPHDDGLVRLDSNGFPVQLTNGQPLELRFSDVKRGAAAARLSGLEGEAVP